MTKGPKVHSRVSDIGLISEHDLQDGNVLDNWSGDGRD